jgi:hypothetical protein
MEQPGTELLYADLEEKSAKVRISHSIIAVVGLGVDVGDAVDYDKRALLCIYISIAPAINILINGVPRVI